MFQLRSIASHPTIMDILEKSGSMFSVSSHKMAAVSNRTPFVPALLQVEQVQFSPILLTRPELQDSDLPGGLHWSLDLLQSVSCNEGSKARHSALRSLTPPAPPPPTG